MPSGYSDSSPDSGSKKAKGMKNEDGRENGAAYNSQVKAPFNPKMTFSPNEDLRQINGGKDQPGLEEGAY